MPFDVRLRRSNAKATHVLLDKLQVLVLASRRFEAAPGALRFVQDNGKAIAPRPNDEGGAVREAHRNRVAGRLGQLGYNQSGELIGERRRDPAFWLSLAYELGSDYGLSVLRPLMWFAGGIMVSTFLLYAIGFYEDGFVGGAGGAGSDLFAKAADALDFSARQAFLPFDALRSTDEVLEDYDFYIRGTGWLRVWGTVLTLFEGLAALLLILAVRWRYRR